MSKGKVIKEILEESPEMLKKILRQLKGESDDAVSKIGSGKNLDALKKAQADLTDATRAQPNAYPKDIVQDDLAASQGFKLEGSPYSKEAVMMADDAALPVLRQNTLPEGASKAAPMSLADTAESLKGSVDDALKPGLSRLQKGAIGGGAAALTGLGMMGITEDEQQPVQPPLLPGQQPSEPEIETDQDMGESADLSQLINMEALQPPKQEAPAPEQPTQTSEIDLMRLLRDAQKGDAKTQFINDMLRAGIQAGSAISGTKADYSVADSVKPGSRGVASVKEMIETKFNQNKMEKARRELDDDKKLRDPRSEASQQIRDMLQRAGYPVMDNLSAQNIKDMGVNVNNLLSQKMIMDSREKAAMLKSTKDNQAFIDGARKTLLKPFQEYQKVNTAFQSVEQFVNSKPSGPKDVALLYNFIKTLDPGSVVREGEIALSQKGMSLFEGLGLKAKRITSGQLLSDNFRRGILDIGRQQKELAENGYRELSRPFIVNAASMGMGEDEMNKFDYMSAKENASPQQKSASSETVRVQRISDGAIKVVPRASTTNMDKNKYKILD